MNNYEVYDAISRIDERFTARADALRRKTAVKRPNAARSGAFIDTKRLTMIAASIIAAIFAFSAVSLAFIKSTPAGTTPAANVAEVTSANEQTPSSLNGVALNAKTIEVSNIDKLSASGEGKESGERYFSIVTIPSIVKNNSDFNFSAALGISCNDWPYNLHWSGQYMFEFFDFAIGIVNRTYEIDRLIDLKESDEISFFGETHDYNEYIDYDRLQNEFKFDPGRTRIEEGDRYRYEFTNIKDASSLPYHMSVPCEINILKEGTKGRLIVGISLKSKESGMSAISGSILYYYCSGEYIGFGSTEKEAYQNSFYTEEPEETLDIIDNGRKSDERGYDVNACL